MRPRKQQAETYLQRLRKAQGFTLNQIAETCGCTRSAVSQWELFQCEPKREDHRQAYAKMLGLTVGRLGEIYFKRSAAKAAR